MTGTRGRACPQPEALQASEVVKITQGRAYSLLRNELEARSQGDPRERQTLLAAGLTATRAQT
jgi:hypothetical protein